MTISAPSVVWFRQDLRTRDQPALIAAASGGPIAAVYVLDDDTPGQWRMGGASRWWLHGSLMSLIRDLNALGVCLTLRRGRAAAEVVRFAQEVGARSVHCTEHVEPFWRQADQQVERTLSALGIAVHRHPGGTLFPLGQIVGRAGMPYQVFTPFWKACWEFGEPGAPLPAPMRMTLLAKAPPGDSLDDWALRPTSPDWAAGLRAAWRPGETAALGRLAEFVDGTLDVYDRDRNRPEPSATSGLSAHLHFGEISARQVWHTVSAACAAHPDLADAGHCFLREVGWREFCYDLLLRHPQLPETALQARFAAFPWLDNPTLLRAWQRGRTGYPIVDAGMRQLWSSGWMHNRARMIVASFLTKHLLLPWQAGEAWFWDTLVDADLANNAGGWQWVAGSGVDSAPYFRIFNPVAQSIKFDPQGDYVRRWVPELSGLRVPAVHQPWEARGLDLAAAGIRLGEDYPSPIVDHRQARARALSAFAAIKTGEGSSATC